MLEEATAVRLAIETKLAELEKRRVENARLAKSLKVEAQDIARDLTELRGAARVLGVTLPLPERADMPSGSVREIVMRKLDEAEECGVKAGPIREFVEGALGKKIHAKTVGMTLYRLAQEGLTYRSGRLWFPAPPT